MGVRIEDYIENIIAWVSTKGIKLIIGIVILCIGWKLVNKLVKVMTKALEKRKVDVTLSSFLDTFVEIVLKIIVVVIFMGYVGIDTAGIAALVASAGVAIGLALQGSLSNFAGGFIILFIRPFKVGDYIETVEYGGVVEQIGLFYTQLATVDNKQILIPNGALSNGSLINYSANATRRVDLMFSVSYDSDTSHVKEVLTNIVENHELVLKEPKPLIRMSAHGASSIDFVVRAWVNTPDYWTVHFDLLEQVKAKFDEENIKIPYPQMDLHVRQ